MLVSLLDNYIWERKNNMYTTSNISPMYQMVSNHLNMSNALIYSELDRVGGGDSPFAKYNCAYSADIANIIPSMLA